MLLFHLDSGENLAQYALDKTIVLYFNSLSPYNIVYAMN